MTKLKIIRMPRPHTEEKYLDETEVIHRKLIVACELATDTEPEPEDDEETKSLLMHENMLTTLSFS